MLKKLKVQFLTLSTGLLLMSPALAPVAVYAQNDIQQGLNKGSCLSTTEANCVTGAEAQEKINRILKTVIDMFSLVVGVISVIMIIVGGLKYITSSGDSSNVTGAKNTILYAVIGLVVVALAQFIVRFVLSKVSAV